MILATSTQNVRADNIMREGKCRVLDGRKIQYGYHKNPENYGGYQNRYPFKTGQRNQIFYH